MPASAKILARSVKNPKKGAKTKLGKKQISKTKQGLETAKRMKDKIGDIKKAKKSEPIDEDIESNEDSEGENLNIKKVKTNGAISADMIKGDNFFAQDNEINETIDEKKLRMTKALIKELGEETKDKEDFFHQL